MSNNALEEYHSDRTALGDETKSLLVHYNPYHIEALSDKKFELTFSSKISTKMFLTPIHFHVMRVRTVTYIIWYRFVQKTLASWYMEAVVCFTALSLSCTVACFVYGLRSCVVLQEGDAKRTCVIVTDVPYAQSVLYAHLQHFSLILPKQTSDPCTFVRLYASALHIFNYLVGWPAVNGDMVVCENGSPQYMWNNGSA